MTITNIPQSGALRAVVLKAIIEPTLSNKSIGNILKIANSEHDRATGIKVHGPSAPANPGSNGLADNLKNIQSLKKEIESKHEPSVLAVWEMLNCLERETRNAIASLDLHLNPRQLAALDSPKDSGKPVVRRSLAHKPVPSVATVFPTAKVKSAQATPAPKSILRASRTASNSSEGNGATASPSDKKKQVSWKDPLRQVFQDPALYEKIRAHGR